MQHDLLTWYDIHARTLPWRFKPGERADPYRVWLAEIMLQQTTVATVKPYFLTFVQRWPRVQELAAAPLDEILAAWAGLGYYSRARNLHACARHVAEELRGQFPSSEEGLLLLPGVGPYTAAAIAAIAFNRPAVVVDGHIDRIMTRLHNSPLPIKVNRKAIYAWAANLTPKERPGDYAQALMDLGATICRPKAPKCLLCPVQRHCLARREGSAAALPTKPTKAPKPTRQGIAYLIQRSDGAILIEKRSVKGLLGGMDGLPTSAWAAESPEPLGGAEDMDLKVQHTFTHFHLHLKVMRADQDAAAQFPAARFVKDLGVLAIPTLFKKVLKAVNAIKG